MPTQKLHNTCTVMRRVFVRHGTLNMMTGESKMRPGGTWEERPCGTPLFGEENRRSGVCRSCAAGWAHPHNYPVGSEPPAEESRGAK